MLLPSFIQLNITNKCNLQCKHCNNESWKPLIDELSNDEIYNTLDYFLEKWIVCITFWWWEPLLHPKIFDFINYSVKRNWRITLLSNWKLINQEIANKIVDLWVARVRLSLDWWTSEINDFIRWKWTFDSVINAIRCLKKTKLDDLAIMTNVNLHNFYDIENLINILIQEWIDDLKLIPTINWWRAKKEFSEYIMKWNFMKKLITLKNDLNIKYKDKIRISIDSPLECILYNNWENKLNSYSPCIIWKVFLWIKPNWDIFSCPMLDNIIIWNIRKDDIKKIWEKSKLLNDVRDLDKLKWKCSNCEIKKYCWWWCRAMSYIYKNDILESDPYCWLK